MQHIDTSGLVLGRDPIDHMVRSYIWSDLTPRQQGYAGALLRSVLSDDTLMGLWRFHHDPARKPGFVDFAAETVLQIIADCNSADNWIPPLFPNTVEAGEQFWEARQKARRTLMYFPYQISFSADGKICLLELTQSA